MIRTLIVTLLLLIWFSALLLGSQAVFLGMLMLVCAAVACEMAAMFPGERAADKGLLALLGITCAVALVCGIGSTHVVVGVEAVMLMVTAPFLGGKPESAFSRGIEFVGWGALLILAEVCLTGLARLRLSGNGAHLVAFVSGCTLFRDLASNVGGRLAGRGHLIASHVNGIKTWRGALIGAGATVLFAWIVLQSPLFVSIGSVRGLLMATACGLGGQFGDVFESLLKRCAGRRDSSHVFTAHQGGVLDAVDGFLCAVPLVEFVIAATTA